MRKLIFILLFTTACLSYGQEKIRLYIAGDSTAQTYDRERDGLITGWGQMIGECFTDAVEIRNHAIGGRSTKSFLAEGRWDRILNEIRPGDYVFIQFGHNDTSTNPERHASPEEYQANLRRFIEEAREKGARPVILTSIVMRTFDRSVLKDDRLRAYPAYARIVAREEGVPMIDAYVKTRDLILIMGNEPSKKLYMWLEPGEDPKKPDGAKDDTHLREEGAWAVARLIAEGIQELQLEGLSEHLRK